MNTILTRKKLWFPKKEEYLKLPAVYTENQLIIHGHQIMDSWETTYMKELVDVATQNGGNILELGFGMWISAWFIQQNKNVLSHTVIECHPEVIKRCEEMHTNSIKSNRLKLLNGFWEDKTVELEDESFDWILFDTYPLSEEQIHKNHFWFFNEAFRLLKKWWILTYYSDESKDFSLEHKQKLIDAWFNNLNYEICEVDPPKDCIYWKQKSLLVPIIKK